MTMIRRISNGFLEEQPEPMLWLPGAEERSVNMGFDFDFNAAANPSGVRVTPETSLKATAVLSCVRVLSESIAGLGVRLIRTDEKGNRERDKANPIDRLLSFAPNAWQTPFEFFEQLMVNVCLYGNSYSLIKRNGSGVPVQLIPLHPTRVVLEEVSTGVLRYTFTDAGGYGTQTYSDEDIMHVRWLSHDGIHGVVPTEVSRDAIALARACELHGSTYFGNGARPGVILETENPIPAETATMLRENWERVHKGVYKSWKTAVLTNGLKAKELGGSNQESQYLEVRRFQLEEVCRVYRVPPHLVMDLNRATYSNIEQQSLDFLQFSLSPWIRRIEQAISRDLIQDDNPIAEFDSKSLMRADAQSRAAYYREMWNLGVLSVNEIREAELMNPVEGGDQRFVMSNMRTLENFEEEQSGEAPEEPQDEESPDDDEAEVQEDSSTEEDEESTAG